MQQGYIYFQVYLYITPPPSSTKPYKRFVTTLDTAGLFLFTSVPIDISVQDAPSVLEPTSLMYTKERE